jgi:hypothetical protein
MDEYNLKNVLIKQLESVLGFLVVMADLPHETMMGLSDADFEAISVHMGETAELIERLKNEKSHITDNKNITAVKT